MHPIWAVLSSQALAASLCTVPSMESIAQLTEIMLSKLGHNARMRRSSQRRIIWPLGHAAAEMHVWHAVSARTEPGRVGSRTNLANVEAAKLPTYAFESRASACRQLHVAARRCRPHIHHGDTVRCKSEQKLSHDWSRAI